MLKILKPELSQKIYNKVRQSYKRTHGIPTARQISKSLSAQMQSKGYHPELVKPTDITNTAAEDNMAVSSRRSQKYKFQMDELNWDQKMAKGGKRTLKQHTGFLDKTKGRRGKYQPLVEKSGGAATASAAETVIIGLDGRMMSNKQGDIEQSGGGGATAGTGGLQWGLGVEHEMQIFHKGKGGWENSNIIFDSQESTCFVTGDDKDKAGACCKLGPGNQCYYHPKSAMLRKEIFKKTDKLTKEEYDFLMSIDWELTGRQVRGCHPDPVIVPRTPVLMPELVTGNFRNRTINSIAAESVAQEEMYIRCQMKNPFTREKVRQYGPLVTHLCGTLDNIKVPKRPTILEREYELEDGKWKDYIGSYHVTITLPHNAAIEPKEFIEMHQRMAIAIQWLEPLLATAFFSPDPSNVGQGKEGIAGSFRVVAVGWGNFAGSDVRKFGTRGISRGAIIPAYWRRGLKLSGTEKVNQCVKTAPPQYRHASTILTSDFRTFGYEPDMDKCKREYNPGDCPKTDGGVMRPPFGMEIRIFDHFPSEYLVDLLKLLVLAGANSARHPPPKVVYRNPAWIKATQAVMTHGWNANLGTDYLAELKHNLGIEIRSDNKLAWDVLCEVVDELHKKNKDHYLVKLLDETPNVKPRIPHINRMCWELSFNQKFYKSMTQILKAIVNTNKSNIAKGLVSSSIVKEKWYPSDKVTRIFYGVLNKIMPGKWSGQIDDILYALQAKGKLALRINKGKITNIKIL